MPHGYDRVGADRSSLLGDALGLGASRQRPGEPRVVYGEGVGGEAPEVVVGLVQGRMRVNGYEVLPDIELGNCGGGGRESRSGSISLGDGLAIAKELLFVFGSH